MYNLEQNGTYGSRKQIIKGERTAEASSQVQSQTWSQATGARRGQPDCYVDSLTRTDRFPSEHSDPGGVVDAITAHVEEQAERNRPTRSIARAPELRFDTRFLHHIYAWCWTSCVEENPGRPTEMEAVSLGSC